MWRLQCKAPERVCICKASEAELEVWLSVLEPETYTDLLTKNPPLRNGPDRWLKVRLSEPEPVDNYDMAEWAVPFVNEWCGRVGHNESPYLRSLYPTRFLQLGSSSDIHAYTVDYQRLSRVSVIAILIV